MAAKILIVDDEASIRDLLTLTLEAAGFATMVAADAQSAEIKLADAQPDVVLLDWMLPGTSGLELARSLRRNPEYSDLNIIMLTARGEEQSMITGLEGGADDYITKPFSNRELISRIKALLRRQQPHLLDLPLVHGKLTLDPVSQQVSVDGNILSLGPTEYRLLAFFMSHPGRVYSREQLLDRVWGANVYIDDRTVDVHILRLRKTLKPSGQSRLIETVRGSGYRFASC